MNVLQNVVIDMLNPRKTIIHVVQGDNARGVELTLLAGNAPFDVSSDLETGETLNNYVEFRKPDGHGGTYDHTSLGVQAVTQKTGTTNVWVLAFDTECFSVPGWTQINVRFETNTGRVLQTFALCADVEPSAGVNEGSGDWDNTGGFNAQVKAALLNLLDHVEYTDENKEQYLAELANAMYRPHGVTYITAVFTQGTHKVYESDSLESLRDYLVVTSHYEDGTSEDVLSYVLSGTLAIGASTVTVTYAGKQTSFIVTVSAIDIVPWATGTDEQIKAMVDAMDAGALSIADTGWQIGDERVVPMAAMEATSDIEAYAAQNVTLVLMDSQHFDLTNGGKDNFVVGMKDCFSEVGPVYLSVASNGWHGSPRRTWCNTTFMSALPATLRACFKQFKVASQAKLADTEVTIDDDYFALFGVKEITGSGGMTYEAAATSLIAYYSTSDNRKKITPDYSGTYANTYWTRSRDNNDSQKAYHITDGGGSTTSRSESASYKRGISVFGCI